jgi:BRCT domain type II-containing protein
MLTKALFSRAKLTQAIAITDDEQEENLPVPASGEAWRSSTDSASAHCPISESHTSTKSVELQQLADEIGEINPSMAEILSKAAKLISDTPWLF